MDYISNVIPDGTLFQSRAIVDEAVSAYRKNRRGAFKMRPGGKLISLHVKRGDHIVFYSIDRMARSLRDFCMCMHEWEERGINVHFITDQINTSTASGRFFANTKAAMAQYASDLLSERIIEANIVKKMRGLPSQGQVRKKYVDSDIGLALPEHVVDRPIGKVHTYTRVSSDQQYLSGLGLARQEEVCERAAQQLCEKLGAERGGSFSDPAVSAFKIDFGDRPQGRKLLETIAPGDDIVIYRSDRAWRSPADAAQMLERLKEQGVYIHLVMEGIHTDTDQGTEWISLLSSIAHLESTLRSRRIKEAMAQARAKGRRTGSLPAGIGVRQIAPGINKLVISPKACRDMAAYWLLRSELGLTVKQVDDTLDAWDAKSKNQKLTLKHKKRRYWQRQDRYVEGLIERLCQRNEKVGRKIWDNSVQAARDKYYRPIEEKFWWRHNWEWPFGVVTA